MEVDSPSLNDCFLCHPAVMEMEAMGNAKFHAFATTCPLPHSNLREKQLEDQLLLEKAKLNPQLFKWISFGDVDLLCVCPPKTEVYRICIPTNLLTEIIEWYHEALGHVGERRLQDTISTHLYHPKLRSEVLKVLRKCSECDQCKLLGKGYGHLPPRNTKIPFHVKMIIFNSDP